jgi:hypothetical protein
VNGWRRLWIVLSALWLIAIASFSLSDFPTRARVQHSWASDLIYERARLEEPERADVVRERYERTYGTDSAVIAAIRTGAALLPIKEATHPDTAWAVRAAILHDAAQYDTALAALPHRQLESIGVAVAFSLGGAALMYLVGAIVAWVIRGFRRKTIRVEVIDP